MQRCDAETDSARQWSGLGCPSKWSNRTWLSYRIPPSRHKLNCNVWTLNTTKGFNGKKIKGSNLTLAEMQTATGYSEHTIFATTFSQASQHWSRLTADSTSFRNKIEVMTNTKLTKESIISSYHVFFRAVSQRVASESWEQIQHHSWMPGCKLQVAAEALSASPVDFASLQDVILFASYRCLKRSLKHFKTVNHQP